MVAQLANFLDILENSWYFGLFTVSKKRAT